MGGGEWQNYVVDAQSIVVIVGIAQHRQRAQLTFCLLFIPMGTGKTQDSYHI